ncbi:MAG: sulfatase [Planctomycetota bacterium]
MPRPNLLFLYTDEQRYDTLAAYGNPQIQMPNLNRLTERATVFERTYVTQPVCTPSRGSLVTGLYPHTHGCIQNNMPLAPAVPALPEMLSASDWATAHIGKWHLGDEIYPQHGFETWLGSEDTYHRFYSAGHEEYADRSAYHYWLKERGVQPEREQKLSEQELQGQPWARARFFRDQIHKFPEEVSRPRFLGEKASEYIRENAGRPWVCYVNFLEPHMPFHSCRDDQYDPSEVTLPPNYGHEFDASYPLAHRVQAAGYRAHGLGGQPLATEEHWRQLTARYWGMCSLVDTHIGRILDTLEETGQMDNTIIVFTSDHGDMMGSHGLLGKGYGYEEDARVPLVVRLPGQTDGRLVTGPVSHIDLVPTLLEAMDQPRPEHLQGRSLLPLATGEQDEPDRDVFYEWNVNPDGENQGPADLPEHAEGMGTPEQLAASKADPHRTIVTPDLWKFTLSRAGEHRLFNLNVDPGETRNLAADATHTARGRDLAGRIRAWQKRTRDIYEMPRTL